MQLFLPYHQLFLHNSYYLFLVKNKIYIFSYLIYQIFLVFSVSNFVFYHQHSQNSKSDIISNTFGVYTLVILKFSINSIGT